MTEPDARSGWDLPYFANAATTTRVARTRGRDPVDVLSFFDGGHRIGDRILAVLLGLGSIVAGLALTGLMLVASFVLSWLSPPDRAGTAFAFACGGAVALAGVALAVATYRHATRPTGVFVREDEVEIAYRTFKTPLRVARASVRAVAIDDGDDPLGGGRFRISGTVPDGAFADALDVHPSEPWNDPDPDRRGPFSSTPPVPWEFPTDRRASRGGYAHDDPELPGWGSSGSHPAQIELDRGRDAFLWSAHGSSLPFLRLRPHDVPNVAILFEEPLRTPRAPWWYDLSPINTRWLSFRGGRSVRGFLVRLTNTVAVEEAFTPWGVVRRVSADDVLEAGLLVAKPLVGFRAIAYAGLVVGPIVLGLLFRLIR